VEYFQLPVREQHGWRSSLNTADVYLVVGWTLFALVKVAVAAGPGSLEAYEELMSVIDNVLRICRPVEGLSVLDSHWAAQAPAAA
jgi:hypothetical protein